MLDRTEAQYQLGEAIRILPILKNNLDSCTFMVKDAKEGLKEAKQYLADKQTQLADVRTQLEQVEDAIRILTDLLPTLLDEPEAVQVLKDCQQYLDKYEGLYTLPSKEVYDKLKMAFFTLDISYGDADDDRHIELYANAGFAVPEGMVEFVYGANYDPKTAAAPEGSKNHRHSA